MKEETIKVGYECKKELFYQGEIDVPKSVFNKGEDALRVFMIEASWELEENGEEFTVEGVGIGCSYCSNEITHTDQIADIDESGGYVNLMCDECKTEEDWQS